MDWEELRRWLRPKIQWTVMMLGMLVVAYGLATLFSKRKHVSSSRAKYLYPSPPEYCYCSKCGAEIDMRKYGLYGKHCREIEKCPVCGAGNYPLWRRKLL